MTEVDALSNFKFPRKEGLFVRLSSDTSPRKMRVLTTDPVVSIDQFGNTRFAFIVWDYNESKARVLNATPGLAKDLQAIHQDEDYGANIKLVDIKISTTGTQLETRHKVSALPNSETLTDEQIKQCQAINLDELVENGERMSFYKSEETEQPEPVAEEQDVVIEDIGDELIDLSDISF